MEHRGLQLIAAILMMYTWLSQWHGVVGLIAYDCEDEQTNITTISLRSVASCPEPSSSYKSESVQLRVLQKAEVEMQHVWTCLVEVTRLITHCGMHSHSSVVAGGLLSYIHRLGAQECRMVHRYRTLKISQDTIGQIILNGTTTASITLQGSLDSTGSCDGVSYQENGMSWHNVVVTATVKIRIMDYLAMVKLKDNEISLKGGVTCPFLEHYCFDSTLGESTWSQMETAKCEGRLSLIYDGQAEKVTNILTGEQYIVVEKEPKIFAVTIVKQIHLCGLELWQTEHPQLLICEGRSQNFKTSTVISTPDTDLMVYVNSKFLYVEQSYKRGLETLYVDTIHRRCLIQREILKNRLILAPIAPDAVSQIIQDREGHMGHVLGEVLYILRCVPKLAIIRRSNRCYHELPVLVNNQSRFMSPITRIIQKFGEEIDCNGLTPPLYYIEGEWIGLVPHPTVKQPPRELEVTTHPKIKFQPIQPLGSRGLYTQEEIGKVQKLLAFGTERKVVENIITRRAAGMEAGGQGFSTLGIFNPEEMKQLAHSTMREMWGWFSEIGIFMSGLIGVYTIFCALKYVVGVLINGLHLYQTVGGGLALLACLWDTLTRWVIHRHQWKQTRAAKDSTPGSVELKTVVSDSSERNEGETSGRVYPAVPAAPHWTEDEARP